MVTILMTPKQPVDKPISPLVQMPVGIVAYYVLCCCFLPFLTLSDVVEAWNAATLVAAVSFKAWHKHMFHQLIPLEYRLHGGKLGTIGDSGR
jgi:hypothetical protein